MDGTLLLKRRIKASQIAGPCQRTANLGPRTSSLQRLPDAGQANKRTPQARASSWHAAVAAGAVEMVTVLGAAAEAPRRNPPLQPRLGKRVGGPPQAPLPRALSPTSSAAALPQHCTLRSSVASIVASVGGVDTEVTNVASVASVALGPPASPPAAGTARGGFGLTRMFRPDATACSIVDSVATMSPREKEDPAPMVFSASKVAPQRGFQSTQRKREGAGGKFAASVKLNALPQKSGRSSLPLRELSPPSPRSSSSRSSSSASTVSSARCSVGASSVADSAAPMAAAGVVVAAAAAAAAKRPGVVRTEDLSASYTIPVSSAAVGSTRNLRSFASNASVASPAAPAGRVPPTAVPNRQSDAHQTLPTASVVLLPSPGSGSMSTSWRVTSARSVSLQRHDSQLQGRQYEFRGGVKAVPSSRAGGEEAQRWLANQIFGERVRRVVQAAGQLCIWLHGPRGAGKSALAWGPPQATPSEGCGIAGDVGRMIFQALRDSSRHEEGEEHHVTMQFAKIGTESELCGDCLESADLDARFRVRDPRPGCGLSLEGLSEVELSSVEDVFAALQAGRRNLAAPGAYGSGRHRVTDARSHGLCTFRARRRDAAGTVYTSTVHLLDLAGAEASGGGGKGKTNGGAAHFRGEGCKGGRGGKGGKGPEDRTLKALLRVVGALAESVDYRMRDGSTVARHIPYRDSKVTRLVSECFGGAGRSLLLSIAGRDAATAGGPGHDAALGALELATLHERCRDGALAPDVFDRSGRLSDINAEAQELAGDLGLAKQFAAGMGPGDLRLAMDSPDCMVRFRDLLEERRRVEASEDWRALLARASAAAACARGYWPRQAVHAAPTPSSRRGAPSPASRPADASPASRAKVRTSAPRPAAPSPPRRSQSFSIASEVQGGMSASVIDSIAGSSSRSSWAAGSGSSSR